MVPTTILHVGQDPAWRLSGKTFSEVEGSFRNLGHLALGEEKEPEWKS